MDSLTAPWFIFHIYLILDGEQKEEGGFGGQWGGLFGDSIGRLC